MGPALMGYSVTRKTGIQGELLVKLGLLPGSTTRWGTQAGPDKMGHVVQTEQEATEKYLLRSPIYPQLCHPTCSLSSSLIA